MTDQLCDFTNLSQWKYLQSQYSWLIIVIVIVIILIKQKPSQITISFESFNHAIDFSFSKDPEYFMHLTDIHVNSLKPVLGEQFSQALEIALKYDPNMLILTGDLVDNWGTNPIGKYAKQYSPDHTLYRQITSKVAEKFKFFIDQPGNHDFFAVKSFDSESNNFLKYSHYYSTKGNATLDEFQISTKIIDDTAYIFVNPTRFPSPRALFDFFAHPTTDLLDRIEKAIGDSRNTKYRILLTHIPADLWDKIGKSSSGRTYYEIIEQSDLDMIISGHSHPPSPAPVHRGKNLEIIGCDLREHRGIGLVTNDNGNIVYHGMTLDKQKKIFITNPAPSSQLSHKTVFNQKKVTLRALIFGEKGEVLANGKQMSFVKTIKQNLQLYQLELELENGENSVTVKYEDEIEQVDIFVGDKSVPRKELLYNYYNKFCCFSTLFYILFPITFFVLFPVPFEFYFQATKDMMMRENIWIYSPNINIVKIIQEFFFGFVSIRWRILRLPLAMRCLLFAACLAPFYIPFVFIKIEDLVGVVTIFGFCIRGNHSYDIWGLIFSAVYEAAVIVPAMILSSSIATSEDYILTYAMDSICWLVGFVICVKFANSYVTETAGTVGANTSPLFIFMPILLLAAVIFCKMYANPSRQSEKLMFFQDLSNSNQIEL